MPGALIAQSWAADNSKAATDTAAQTSTAQIPYELSSEKMFEDTMLMMALFFFIFYFILIRPQNQRLKIHRETMKALQKGHKVHTSGGIIGTIHKFEGDDIVVLEIAPNTKVRVTRQSISEIAGDKAAAGESANDN